MKTGPVPKHIAVIMDGNRTYAKKHNLALKDGHYAGAESLVHVLDTGYRMGIECITIYAFSIENFSRSPKEVDTLFNLLREKLNYLSENKDSFVKLNQIQVKIIGNKSMIPSDILVDLEDIEAKTANNSNRFLNVCFPYTSRDDITNAIQKVRNEFESGALTPSEICVNSVTNHMYFGPNIPPLDILIRTSGHTRLSDFMLWQANYNCTIEFVNTLWPEFKFIHTILVLLKWQYYKTLQIEQNASIGKLNADDEKQVLDILKELPPHPPYKIVSEK